MKNSRRYLALLLTLVLLVTMMGSGQILADSSSGAAVVEVIAEPPAEEETAEAESVEPKQDESASEDNTESVSEPDVPGEAESAEPLTPESEVSDPAVFEESSVEADATSEAEEVVVEAQPLYPEASFEQTASNGLHVTASVDEGVFPEGTAMRVTAISSAQAEKIAQAAAGASSEISDAVGADISFFDREGREIEPAAGRSVRVSLSLSEAIEGDSFSVVHQPDSGEAEIIGAAELVGEVTENGATFDAGSFSIYVINGVNDPAIATYRFYDSDGTLLSVNAIGSETEQTIREQRVKNGETVYPPTTPERDGQVFLGWARSQGATSADIAPTAAFTAEVTQTADISLYAVYAGERHVFFMDGSDRVAITMTVHDGDMVDVTEVTLTQDATHSVSGWYRSKAEAQSGTGRVTNLTVSGADVTLWPRIEAGHFLNFETGAEATKLRSQFVPSGQRPVQPAQDPTRPGYTFRGWARSADAQDANFNFSQALNSDETAYALWRADADTPYTVVYWTENAEDDDYSYVSAETRTGTTGQQISLGTPSTSVLGNERSHFSYNRAKTEAGLSEATIAGDGSTVVNVYFSRNTYTLTFREQYISWFDRRWRTLTTITAKYDADISSYFTRDPFLDGYSWEDAGKTVFSERLQTLQNMPGADITFNRRNPSSNTKKTIRYYLQNIDSTLDTWPTSDQTGANYTLLKSIVTCFNYITYNEEYHEIKGFERFTSSQAGFSEDRKDFSGNTVALYYKRAAYELRLQNGSQYSTEDVRYEASVTDYLATVPERPADVPEGYRFAGWFYDPDGAAGTEATLTTMPSENVILYAKWEPAPVSAAVHLDVHGDGSVVALRVPYGQALVSTDLPTVKRADGTIISQGSSEVVTVPEDASWGGWTTKSDSGVLVPWNSAERLYNDIELFPSWTSGEVCEVRYFAGDAEIGGLDDETYALNAEARVQSGGSLIPPDSGTFLYWTDRDGGIHYPNDTIQITEELLESNPGGNRYVKLDAFFGDPAKYTKLTYSANYPEPKDGISEIEETLPNNTQTEVRDAADCGFAITGYSFKGWNTKDDGTGTDFAPGMRIGVDVFNQDAQNILYAQWEVRYVTLSVSKLVTGNMGDVNKSFSFAYSLASGKVKDSDETSGTLNIRSGETKTLTIQEGSSLTVTETSAGDGYETSYQVGGGAVIEGTEAALTEVMADTSLAFTNNKNVSAPTGVRAGRLLPGLLMIALALLLFLGFAGRRRRPRL